jgi:hypothetical protein
MEGKASLQFPLDPISKEHLLTGNFPVAVAIAVAVAVSSDTQKTLLP